MHQTFDAALGVNLLHANQSEANHNRDHFDAWGITCLNVMSRGASQLCNEYKYTGLREG